MEQRLLETADAELLDAFLSQHRDSSMFLRSNAQRAGLEDRGQHLQASYVGTFLDGVLVGVAAHCWNGMLLVQSPQVGLAEAAREAVKRSRRGVNGFAGPVVQVQAARQALGLEGVPTQIEEIEGLFGLDLPDLCVPAPLQSGAIECRPPLPAERELLGDWRLAFDTESLGAKPSASARKRAGEHVDTQIQDGNAWVAVQAGAPTSYAAFNAALPDIVQLGGVYTPPSQRGRGYAKVAVAGALLAARQRGASRAVLFTKNPSAARSYEGVGFRRIGDYALVLLAEPS